MSPEKSGGYSIFAGWLSVSKSCAQTTFVSCRAPKIIKKGITQLSKTVNRRKKKLCNSVYISRDFHRASKHKGFNFKHDSESKCDKSSRKNSSTFTEPLSQDEESLFYPRKFEVTASIIKRYIW